MFWHFVGKMIPGRKGLPEISHDPQKYNAILHTCLIKTFGRLFILRALKRNRALEASPNGIKSWGKESTTGLIL